MIFTAGDGATAETQQFILATGNETLLKPCTLEAIDHRPRRQRLTTLARSSLTSSLKKADAASEAQNPQAQISQQADGYARLCHNELPFQTSYAETLCGLRRVGDEDEWVRREAPAWNILNLSESRQTQDRHIEPQTQPRVTVGDGGGNRPQA